MTKIEVNTADPSRPLPSPGAAGAGGISAGLPKGESGPAPAPVRPTHSFTITAGRRGSTVGYNAPGNIGSIAAGSSADYATPGGKNVTVIHCRSVSGALNFSLRGAAAQVADFPVRIVATKLTGGEVERTFTPQARDPRGITGGIRQDYDPTAGTVGDVLVNNQNIRIDLYY